MSIRTKIGIILLCAVICFCAAEYAVQRFVILPGFYSLERDEAVKDAERVIRAIDNEISHLDGMGWDWSAWDDTYAFVKSRSVEYITSNLVQSTFTDNRLNLIFICGASGQVVWGKAVGADFESAIDLKLFPTDFFPPAHPLLIRTDTADPSGSVISGIINTEAGLLAVSASPIIKSNNDGPVRGTFIMGRFLDAGMVEKITQQTQVDFSLMPVDDSTALPREENSSSFSYARYKVSVVDNDTLQVHSILNDVQKHPAVALSAYFQRNISAKGYETSKNGILSILVAGMGILILVLLSLKKTILQPISMLNQQVLSIRETGDLSKRVKLKSDDEIGMLANAFDRMISRIERITHENNDINKQLRLDNEKRKQADEKNHQARKMEALTTLTAGIAHNFNNILTVIIGCAELSSARLPKDNPAANFLKKIEDAGSRAKEIVWQLIRFSQRQENNFKLVQVDSVIEKEIRGIESVTTGKIKLISQWQPDSYPVIGDSDQIGDLIKNLLANAVESIKNDTGVVEVQLDNIADPSAINFGSESLKKRKYIRLIVRDNGRGIDPYHMERIFDPFFTTKDFSKGAGMGLAVVRGLVINHSGTITVNSKVGKGTEIIIFLPAAEPAG